MSNVIELFPKKENESFPKTEPKLEPAWRCGCGSMEFFFYWDGELECTSCGKLQEGHDEFLT